MSDPVAGTYVGRFAPSPTGPLHFGSLVAAVASYLDARASGGRWLVRMEDIDPPRNTPEAAAEILRALERFALEWDGDVLYQSSRLESYAFALSQLVDRGLIFPCTCARTPAGKGYSGKCRSRSLQDPPRRPHALRVMVGDSPVTFADLLQGSQEFRLAEDPGDFVVRRKDGLFAYQLAVVVDDAFQQVTRVVRGIDLIDSTPRQIYLQRQLGLATPEYAHIPVITGPNGSKLSKQTFAAPLVQSEPSPFLVAALAALGLAPPAALLHERAEAILGWGTAHWDLAHVPRGTAIPQAGVPFLDGRG